MPRIVLIGYGQDDLAQLTGLSDADSHRLIGIGVSPAPCCCNCRGRNRTGRAGDLSGRHPICASAECLANRAKRHRHDVCAVVGRHAADGHCWLHCCSLGSVLAVGNLAARPRQRVYFVGAITHAQNLALMTWTRLPVGASRCQTGKALLTLNEEGVHERDCSDRP